MWNEARQRSVASAPIDVTCAFGAFAPLEGASMPRIKAIGVDTGAVAAMRRAAACVPLSALPSTNGAGI
eukprot:3046601-Pleurochrysis_carterae.AAC.11